MITLSPSILRNDSAGSGEYGAPRGSRTHRGVDYLCKPGDVVFSPISGICTKHGVCYEGDPEWRYVEITDDYNFRHRLFYVKPLVKIDEFVTKGQVVGEAQDIRKKYPGSGMLAHIHYEVKDSTGEYMNPMTL